MQRLAAKLMQLLVSEQLLGSTSVDNMKHSLQNNYLASSFGEQIPMDDGRINVSINLLAKYHKLFIPFTKINLKVTLKYARLRFQPCWNDSNQSQLSSINCKTFFQVRQSIQCRKHFFNSSFVGEIKRWNNFR